jgi:D-glycero-alpha-D-manno-heptose 1-phosphate guanylyltransferase
MNSEIYQPNFEVDGIIVLAGGEGTRLRPLTFDVPKILVPFMNNTYLYHLLSYLDMVLPDLPVAISAGYKADQLHNLCLPKDIFVVTETTPLGTGGAIVRAIKETGFKNPLVINGDCLIDDIDLEFFVREAQISDHWCTILGVWKHNASRYGNIQVEDDIIVRFVEKSPTPLARMGHRGLISSGIYIINSLKYLNLTSHCGERFSIEKEVFEKCNDMAVGYDRFIASYDMNSYIDIGTIESYRDSQVRIAGGNPVIHKTVVIGSATLVDNSVIHEGVRIGNNCLIDRCVIASNVTIEDNCELKDICIASRSVIKKGTKLC